jgi:multidrug transporter EmrE-like cation transporter
MLLLETGRTGPRGRPIGSVVFSERFGRRRVVAAAFITAGIVLLDLAR